MIFETKRLLLRPWEEADAEALYLYAKDPRIGPIAGWPPHTSAENSLDIIKTVLSAPETYAVVLKDTNQPIGSIGLMFGDGGSAPIGDTECEVGYWLGVPYWGRGYTPEAVNTLLSYAFSVLKVTAVWCGYFDGNTKSKRVQEKCGFQYHHTVEKKEVPLLQEVRKEHLTRLTREHWQENQGEK